MSFGLMIVAFALVANPARVGLALRAADVRQIGYSAVVTGALLVLGAVALLAAFSDTLLGGLNVSPETFALSGAAVMAVAGVRVFIFTRFRNLPSLSGWRAVLIPVAIPLLFTPELVLLAATAASLETASKAVAAAAIALLLVVAGVVAVRRSPSELAISALARLLAAGAVAAAVAIALDALYRV